MTQQPGHCSQSNAFVGSGSATIRSATSSARVVAYKEVKLPTLQHPCSADTTVISLTEKDLDESF